MPFIFPFERHVKGFPTRWGHSCVYHFVFIFFTQLHKSWFLLIRSACLVIQGHLSKSDGTVHVTSPQERPVYKGSQTTLDEKWGPRGRVEVDELGRPAVWPDGRKSLSGTKMEREKEERRRRVVSYLKNSNMSLVQYDINCREISLKLIEVFF